ncbi:sensor domain-containing diguanylate cyclase [Malonomonas rubra]|uniref:sensor domain-containing diguanylate cyclase n=1 Tax=Malonomonas rubra TaxID=57040 RepID=UPI0026F036AE|nr:sensor domain-containing diguanylate cyclase [Malonomonas rubra]
MSNVERKLLGNKSLNAFLFLFAILSSLLIGMISAVYRLQSQNYVQRLFAEEQHSVNLQRAVVRNLFASLHSDLDFLAGQDILQAYLQQPTEDHLAAVQKEYLFFIRNKKIYDKVRYIENSGLEVVRVNYNAGRPRIVTTKQLQNKFPRYYFAETYPLSKGQTYISPLDLNVEREKVEVPFKPVIRFAAPVFDRQGQKRGIVVLNYLGKNLLDLIQNVGSVARGQTMLLNSDGYWLKHPQANYAWGFMFDERSHLTFAKKNPQVWRQMLASPSGQVKTDSGIYTYTTLEPLENSVDERSGSEPYFWKIYTFISSEKITAHTQSLLNNLFLLTVGLLFGAAVVAWFFTLFITRRKLHRKRLLNMAHYDSLTGLPNRMLFFDRLKQTLENAKRHGRQCALLYIALDGFKQVNDNFGHVVGDELLTVVAKKMARCCRSADTLARLGGDEFALLMVEVNSSSGVQTCAEKMLELLHEPFHLKQGEVVIGASIGIALFPAHGTNQDVLFKRADQAMYVSKNHGKNRYTFAEG